MKKLFNLAGCSFEGRPELLKALRTQGKIWLDLVLKNVDYEGEPAIAVYDYESKIQLGWVPKELVPHYLNITRLSGRIVGSTHIGVECFAYEKPTQKQYFCVKRYCQKIGKPLPPYSRAAYENVLLKIKLLEAI